MSSEKKQQTGNPAQIVLDFSRTMQEYGLSTISYKGKDSSGNEIDVKLESSLPIFNTTQAMPMPAPAVAAPVMQATPVTAPTCGTPIAAPVENANIKVVKSPMIGVIYVAPKPDAAPFIKVGDKIKEGQDLFIIECMKTMNPVKSNLSGTVKEILIENGKPVEYNQQLVRVEVE